MIPETKLTRQAWQQELIQAISDPNELLTLLDLQAEQLDLSEVTLKNFALKVPHAFLSRIQPAEPNDPLLKQILPICEEETITPGFCQDPLDEQNNNPLPGLLHKYSGRVLLTVSGACGIHCRYCFRRDFPYQDNNPGKQGWGKIIDYIRADKSVEEVILSGGDPLVASDQHLAKLCQSIDSIPHIKRIRIHTRMPIVIPNRVCDDLLHWLADLKSQTIIVVHTNHANEIDTAVEHALLKLRQVSTHVFNQAVLLAGVNDNVESLTNLSMRLSDCSVLPYYLHLLDKVQGAAHFEVSEQIARELVWEMSQKLPGYLVPKLVREVAGMPSKVPVDIQQGKFN